MDDRIGSLEQGKLADIVLLDLGRAQLIPAANLPAVLVWQANGSEVDTVLVDGEVVVRHGRPPISRPRRSRPFMPRPPLAPRRSPSGPGSPPTARGDMSAVDGAPGANSVPVREELPTQLCAGAARRAHSRPARLPARPVLRRHQSDLTPQSRPTGMGPSPASRATLNYVFLPGASPGLTLAPGGTILSIMPSTLESSATFTAPSCDSK